MANIIVGGVQIFATVLAAVFMDLAGRRVLLLLSSFFMVISISVLGLYFYISTTNAALAVSIGWVRENLHVRIISPLQVPLASLSLFVFAFSIGFGPIPWLMMSELFAPEVQTSSIFK